MDSDLEENVQRAASIRGESVSAFVRRAAEVRADATF
jgi:uncharacterized protein (DUF1778 family)